MMLKGGFTLIVAFTIVHVVNGQENPDVSVLDATFEIGEDANIKCNYTIYGGRTLLSAIWYTSTSTGVEINELINSAGTNPNGRYSVDTTTQANITTLTISNAVSSDEGFYRCQIVDSGGKIKAHFASLTVQFFDTVMIDIINSPVIEGESAMIVCSVNANPDPVIILFKDDTEIKRETNTSLTYMIDSVARGDARNYKCEASNVAGSGTSQVQQLEVHYFDTIVFEISSSVTEGEPAMFVCSVEANPIPVIILYKGETEITRETTTSLTYTIASVTESDGGNYTCEASNIAGNDTSQIETLVVDESTPTPTPVGEETATTGITRPTLSSYTTANNTDSADDVVSGLSTGEKVAIGGGTCITVLGCIYCFYCWYAGKCCFSKNKPQTLDHNPPDDVEMDKAEGKSDLERYQASGGELYTQVNLQQKKKKPDSDNGSNKPAPVDLNAEGLQYADLDLTRNCPAGKQDVINHPDSETMYSSITHQI